MLTEWPHNQSDYEQHGIAADIKVCNNYSPNEIETYC